MSFRSITFCPSGTVSTVPEEEILTINNVALDWANPEIENTFDGKVSVIKYCMYQIDAHELSITFRDKTITSKDSCVSLNAVFLKSDIGQKISVGVEETAGICKRKRKRYFFLEQGGSETQVFFCSNNDMTKFGGRGVTTLQLRGWSWLSQGRG